MGMPRRGSPGAAYSRTHIAAADMGMGKRIGVMAVYDYSLLMPGSLVPDRHISLCWCNVVPYWKETCHPKVYTRWAKAAFYWVAQRKALPALVGWLLHANRCMAGRWLSLHGRPAPAGTEHIREGERLDAQVRAHPVGDPLCEVVQIRDRQLDECRI